MQVLTLNDFNNVLIQGQKLRQDFGQPVLVLVTSSGSTTQFKIIVGQTGSSLTANDLKDRVRRAGYNGAFVKNLGML